VSQAERASLIQPGAVARRCSTGRCGWVSGQGGGRPMHAAADDVCLSGLSAGRSTTSGTTGRDLLARIDDLHAPPPKDALSESNPA
jgi:hypothetical protein